MGQQLETDVAALSGRVLDKGLCLLCRIAAWSGNTFLITQYTIIITIIVTTMKDFSLPRLRLFPLDAARAEMFWCRNNNGDNDFIRRNGNKWFKYKSCSELKLHFSALRCIKRCGLTN